MKYFKKISNLNFISIFFTALVIYKWFTPGFMMATAEEGIPLYNAQRTFQLYKKIWVDTQLGLAMPFYPPRITYLAFCSFLQYLGFSNWLIQAVLFFLLVLTPFLIIPKLVEHFFSKTNNWIKFTVSFFYVFNLFTLSQVWMRFIYELIFVWSFLPLFLYLWIKWVDTKKFKYLILFLLSNVTFSNSYALTASVLTLWIPAGLYSLYKLFEKDGFKKTLVVTLIGMMLWLITNLWWIYPVYHLRNNSFSEMLSAENNMVSLINVSKYYSSNDIFLLRQKFWFGEQNQVYEYYQQEETFIISLFVLLTTFYGLVSSSKLKNGKYLVGLFFLSWFLVKGANRPFGKLFYSNLFRFLPATQLIRNPYEKLGSVWLLVYTLLFGFGISQISKIIKKDYKKVLSILVLMLLGYLSLPLIKGEILVKYKTRVPGTYKDIDEYVKENSCGRVMHLPFLRFNSAKYLWGYQGSDISDFLFENRVVSRAILYGFEKNYYEEVLKNIENKNFTNILNTLNVDYLVLNKSFIPNSPHQESYIGTKNILENWKDIYYDISIGDTEVYRINYDNDLDDVYLVTSIKIHDNLGELMNYIVSDRYDEREGNVVLNDSGVADFGKLIDLSLFTINYRKHSAERYEVQIKNAEKPFVIVLSNSFNPLWEAKIDGNSVEDHFRINGYANAWYIDKIGDYSIYIKFNSWPWE